MHGCIGDLPQIHCQNPTGRGHRPKWLSGPLRPTPTDLGAAPSNEEYPNVSISW